jgi:hypothetical protein
MCSASRYSGLSVSIKTETQNAYPYGPKTRKLTVGSSGARTFEIPERDRRNPFILDLFQRAAQFCRVRGAGIGKFDQINERPPSHADRRVVSGGFAMVIVEHSTQPLATLNCTRGLAHRV